MDSKNPHNFEVLPPKSLTGRRGPQIKPLIKEALRRAGRGEHALLDEAVARAFDLEDKASGPILLALLARMYPEDKAAMPVPDIDLSGIPSGQWARAVTEAIVSGQCAPDVGERILASIKAWIEIESASGELAETILAMKARIDEIERQNAARAGECSEEAEIVGVEPGPDNSPSAEGAAENGDGACAKAGDV